MTRRWASALAVLAAVLLIACERDNARTVGPAGGSALRKYVSIGTSVSMGVQSDGVVYTTQVMAWPALVARQAMQPFQVPQIQGPGCYPPLIAPLQLGRRLSGPAAPASTTCAALYPGISLPTNDVAIDGARTYDALNVTPQTAGTDFVAGAQSPAKRTAQYARVLGSGQTQVTAMMAKDPTFVSVELGANDVLQVTGGVLAPGLTFVPFTTWQPLYDAIVDSVVATGAKAVLVGLPTSVGDFPAVRRASELHADSLAFHARYVTVSSDCNSALNRDNLIFVPIRVLGAVAAGAQAAAAGQPRPVLSCADVPAAQDYVLTPADQAFVAGLLGQMNAHIEARAAEEGFAFFSLGELYELPKAPFSLAVLLGTTTPYGPNISLDGLHPANPGHIIIANAAIAAINETYGSEIPQIPTAAALAGR